uniref:Response regulator with CheY-like receiver domain and winged-helix DNA-binding domain n=1 Tax=Desulfovibrio sp. U5L TaxID=596152 RepID=I2Q5M5_9BACT
MPKDAHGLDQDLPSLAVLVVDDNDVNRLYMLHLLRKFGHRPATASNGREALDMMSREPFDVVLMDVQLPDMDGLAVTRIVRAGQCGTANPANIPILALTAFAMAEDRERCLEAGMDDHLGKPVRVPELLAAVARSVERRRSGLEPRSPEPAAFDLSAFTRESRKEFATEMLALFLELAEPKGKSLAAAVKEGDIEAAMALAHDLAGMAGPLRAKRLHETMKALQEACLTGNLPACRAHHTLADRELATVLCAVRAHPYLSCGTP